MKKFSTSIFLVLSVHVALAQVNKQDQIRKISNARAASNKAIVAHDVNGISRYWVSDFVQVRGNASHLTGKDTIISIWKQLFAANPKVSYIRNPAQIIISDNDTLAW